MPELRVLLHGTEPDEKQRKVIQDLKTKGTFSEEELDRIQYYLMSVPYAKGLMDDAIAMNEANQKYSVEEFYQAILDN